jgi:hypothetical protein
MENNLLEIDENTEALSNADWTPSVAGTVLAELDNLSARERNEQRVVRRIGRERVARVTGLGPSVIRSVWLMRALKSIAGLLSLQPNWDSYGASPIDPKRAGFALSILTQLMGDQTPPPTIVPTVSGGIQLEWHMKGIDLEVEVSSEAEGTFYVFDHNTGYEQEGSIPEGIKNLREEVLAKLSG